ncbi:uncharacterized protein LOC114533489 [Dendronephthya gigantea]|uniref:uncharacterized protein LOC114533489 n=1 Tax=Dendronephthya gigantea TaxID=151771 RepID=UPI00106A3D73|nr:uncharacterized protein LOC114533489 [Dendronephthya gigantea]
MGNDTSLPLVQVPPGFSTMCIALQYGDGITVIHHDSGTLSTMQQAIIDAWPNGIQREHAICGTGWMFKVKGNPFDLTFSTSQQTRQLIATILNRLFSLGWRIVVSCDLGRFSGKSTIFLKRSPINFTTVHPFVCVGFSSSDKLQILNLPSHLIPPLKEVIYHHWTKGIQNESYENGVLEIKMSGNPWCTTMGLSESAMANVLLQNIVTTLYSYQYVFTVNVNPKSVLDSLFFRYDPELPAGQPGQFCTISLSGADRLRVICAPESTVNMIRCVIQNVWSHGTLQEEKDNHGSWEFKISGNPWFSYKEESVMARYLILKILEAMLNQGWHNIAVIDISLRPIDKSVLIFQQREPKHCSIMCLSLNDADKFRCINMPTELVESFKKILLSRWSKGIQEEKVKNLSFGGVRQFKLNGRPFNGGLNNDAYHIRSFLCNIIEAFAARSWRVYMAGDVSGQFVHSIWFIYDPPTTQQPTAPAFGFASSSPYGTGMPAAPYPPMGSGVSSAYGGPPATAPTAPTSAYGLYPNPNEPSPINTEATGWNRDPK